MTTHLVIADIDTLRILLASERLVPLMGARRDERGRVFRHVETGDTWLFRTPDDSVADACDLVYAQSVMGAVAGSKALRHHRAGDRQRRILPLIAACDLLGVDEL